LVCIEQPRRRADERFTTSEKVFIKFGDKARLYDVKDISASGMRLVGEIGDPVGSPATVVMEGIESPAVIARKGPNEFAVSLIGDEAREAMTRRVYSERYGKPIETVDPSRVVAGILNRLAR
jgi:cellulose synthase (UDP-forming)